MVIQVDPESVDYGTEDDPRIEQLCSDLAALRTENDGLREAADIIAKLPVTKDDVPVVPGMTVYWMYPTERSGGAKYCSTSGRVCYVKTMSPDECRNMFIYPIEVETDNGTPYLRDCYSTRQAAEEAAGTEGGAG